MRTNADCSNIARIVTIVATAILTASAANGAPPKTFDTAQLGQGGSLALDDLMPLIGQAPGLKREITDAAAKAGKPPSEIICGGMRFSGQWEHLGGYRVSPYVCKFGDDKFLEIRADVRITGRDGKAFERVSKEAMRNASRIRETNPTWKWLSEDPRPD